MLACSVASHLPWPLNAYCVPPVATAIAIGTVFPSPGASGFERRWARTSTAESTDARASRATNDERDLIIEPPPGTSTNANRNAAPDLLGARDDQGGSCDSSAAGACTRRWRAAHLELRPDLPS